MPVTVSVEIAAPIDEVWRHAADFKSHDEWMSDAASIEFLSEQHSGRGTTMAVETRIGPLRTTDVIEVLEVEPPYRITVRHRGIFTGHGEFRLEPIGPLKTRFVWDEDLHFPWYFGARWGARVASPILASIWRANLQRLRLQIEGAAPS